MHAIISKGNFNAIVPTTVPKTAVYRNINFSQKYFNLTGIFNGLSSTAFNFFVVIFTHHT